MQIKLHEVSREFVHSYSKEKVRPTWDLDGNFDVINKSILDFKAGGAEVDAKVAGAIQFGEYEVSIQLHAKPITLSAPVFLGSSSVPGNLLADSVAGIETAKVDLIKWDMGFVEFNLRRNFGSMEDKQFSGDASMNMKQHVLFNFDADFWDDILYQLIPDVEDLQGRHDRKSIVN